METELDQLTGLPTRTAFIAELVRAVARALHDRSPLALVLFKVDDLNAVNRELGLRTGDEMLRRISRVLRKVAPDPDVVARVGDDEFAVLLVGTTLVHARWLGGVVQHHLANTRFYVSLELRVSYGSAALGRGDDALSPGEPGDRRVPRHERRPAGRGRRPRATSAPAVHRTARHALPVGRRRGRALQGSRPNGPRVDEMFQNRHRHRHRGHVELAVEGGGCGPTLWVGAAGVGARR